jgi:hypothetical protein
MLDVQRPVIETSPSTFTAQGYFAARNFGPEWARAHTGVDICPQLRVNKRSFSCIAISKPRLIWTTTPGMNFPDVPNVL